MAEVSRAWLDQINEGARRILGPDVTLIPDTTRGTHLSVDDARAAHDEPPPPTLVPGSFTTDDWVTTFDSVTDKAIRVTVEAQERILDRARSLGKAEALEFVAEKLTDSGHIDVETLGKMAKMYRARATGGPV